MDMYQKSKMRKEKSVNNVEENNKMNINCDVGINGNHLESIKI